MNRIILSVFSFVLSTLAFAQSADPVIMTINGKPVTRGEFEYAFNKNGSIEGAVEKKTVGEYADMFVNYKLKVAAAEAERLDTLASFRKEFAQYRDMQLTPYLIDEQFIDSVARSIYQRSADVLKGQDMLRLSHILILVPQTATAEEEAMAAHRADSLHKQILAGADFASLAKQYSGDPGSAKKGGELPWIGPGMTLKAFEDAAYALNTAGELSRPVKTSVGYHIIKLEERKQLEPYDVLKEEIIPALKKQGIEDASAEYRINKMVAASGGTLTREAIMDSVLNAELNSNMELKYLVQEYHDGLLLYEISKRKVWDVAANDLAGLEATFKANKKKYVWDEPRFKGFVIHAKSPKALKSAQKVLKKYGEKDWRGQLKLQINKDSVVARVSGPYMMKPGENPYIDECVFGGDKAKVNENFPYLGVCGKKMKKPKTYLDVKSLVETDYQQQLEKVWVDEMRRRFPFSINQDVLDTVNKH